MDKSLLHHFVTPNVQIEGLRAFAQSLSNAGLGKMNDIMLRFLTDTTHFLTFSILWIRHFYGLENSIRLVKKIRVLVIWVIPLGVINPDARVAVFRMEARYICKL